MRVRLLDHEGPKKVPAVLAAVGFVFLLVPGAVGPAALVGTFPFATTLLGLAIAKPFSLRSRDVDVTLGPGSARVRNGFTGFRIRSRDVLGSTTSLHAGKVALSLVLAARPHTPVTFVFDTADDAEKMRASLALARDGTGEAHFPSEVPSVVRNGRALALAASILSFVALCLLGVEAGLTASGLRMDQQGAFVAAGLVAILCIACVPVLLLASLVRFTRAPVERTRRLAFRREALYVPTPTGALNVPYASIRSVAADDKRIVIDTEERRFEVPIALPPDHVAVVASHVEAARLRAVGDTEQRGALVERLAFLARAQPAESIVAWLARIDALAASMGGSGYRGTAIDQHDLRDAMADPDLALDYRLAATRMLVKLAPETRIRVAELAENAPSPAHAKLFRIADEPVDAVLAAYQAMAEEEERVTLKRRVL